MMKPLLGAVSLALLAAMPGSAAPAAERGASAAGAVGYVRIGGGITLRRLVVRPRRPEGVVLLLHGFPETVHAWDGVIDALRGRYEVHAFDWPGYGHSSRPAAERFGYAPRDYARVLEQYVRKTGIDRSKLVIYATDIGALPALLLALDEPDVARRIVVGDFAPFDRPDLMYPSLQSLKVPATAPKTRAYMNSTRDEILANTFYRGLPEAGRYPLTEAFREDMARGWPAGPLSPADAFALYYAGFTRDQDHLEAHLGDLKTPITIVWGGKDLYIDPKMGEELAARTGAALRLLPGAGHYPHLQDPEAAAEEIKRAFGD